MRAVKDNLASPLERWIRIKSEVGSLLRLRNAHDQNVLVRRAQSRIDQATLENEMGNWDTARSGRRPPLSSSSRPGHESIWIHLMNLF